MITEERRKELLHTYSMRLKQAKDCEQGSTAPENKRQWTAKREVLESIVADLIASNVG